MGVASVLFGGLLGFVAAVGSLFIFGASWQVALAVYFGSGITASVVFLRPAIYEQPIEQQSEDRLEIWKRELGFKDPHVQSDHKDQGLSGHDKAA